MGRTLLKLKKISPCLFIDDIHLLLSLGNNNDSGADIVGVIKKYIEERGVKIIGSTTYSDYQKYLERHKTLVRRFQQIVVEEPDKDTVLKIMQGLKSQYEKHHNIKIGSAIRKDIVDMAERYMPNEKNPQKSIKLMDAAGAYHVMHVSNGDNKLDNNSVLKALSKMCNVSNVEDINEMQNLLTLDRKSVV